MKININEGDAGFSFYLIAETVEDASRLARMALNVKDVRTSFHKDCVTTWIQFPVNKNRKQHSLQK